MNSLQSDTRGQNELGKKGLPVAPLRLARQLRARRGKRTSAIGVASYFWELF